MFIILLFRTRRSFRGFKISLFVILLLRVKYSWVIKFRALIVILDSFRILLLRNCWFFLQNGSLVFLTRVNLTRRLKILQQSHDSPPGRSSCKTVQSMCVHMSDRLKFRGF